MAGVARLQAWPSSELLCESIFGTEAKGRRLVRGCKHPISTLFPSPGIGIGSGCGEKRRSLTTADSREPGLRKRISCWRNWHRDVFNCGLWWRGTGWQSEARRMDFFVRGSGGEARDMSERSVEVANDAISERSNNRGQRLANFFVDQDLEYNVGNLVPEGADRVDERTGGSNVKLEGPVVKESSGEKASSEWQVNEERGLEEGEMNYGRDNRLSVDVTHCLELIPARARFQKNDQERSVTNDQARSVNRDVGLREENFEEDVVGSARTPFASYESTENDEAGPAPAFRFNSVEQGQGEAQRLAADDVDSGAGSFRVSGRYIESAQRYHGQVDTELSAGYGENSRDVRIDQDDKTESEIGIGNNVAYVDEKKYMGISKGITQNWSVEKNIHGSRGDEIEVQASKQRSSRRPAESYPYSTIYAQPSESALGRASDYDKPSLSGTPIENWESEAGDQNWRPGPSNLDKRSTFQTRKRYEGPGIPVDQEIESGVVDRESTGNETSLVTNYDMESEEVLARGAVYAKQVISLATAQSVGFVTQVWVDFDSLKVVALEVRPNLLFGNVEGILLTSLNKVGDVVLVHDDAVIPEEVNLLNCSDLVGIDLLTENGFYLGKVRDYSFSLGDGEVVSLEFDTFGIPFIPSTVISTYSLAVDEVIEAQDDNLLVRKGAEKRVRKLTKGLFSRPRKPSTKRQARTIERRKHVPQLTTATTSYAAEGPEFQDTGTSTSKDQQRINVTAHNYTPTLSTSRKQEPKRGNLYSGDRRVVGEPLDPSATGRDLVHDLYPDKKFSSQVEDLLPEQQDDSPIETNRRAEWVEDTPSILNKRESRPPRGYMSAPQVSLPERGLPMSYRTAKKKNEDDL